MTVSSLVLQLLWQSALVPTFVALAVLAASRALRLDGLGAVAAITTAFIASYFAALHEQWSLVPHHAMDWMPWIAMGAAAGALALEGVGRAPLRLALRFAIGLAVGGLVAWGALASLGPAKAALTAAGIGLLVAVVWTAQARFADGGARRPLLLSIVAGGAGLSMMVHSSQQIGQLSGALAAALGTCMLFNLPRVRVPFPPAAKGAAVVVLCALVANAYVFAGFPAVYVALLTGGLLADAVLDAAARLRRRNVDPRSWIPAAVLTALPVAATVAMVLKAAQDSGGF